MSEVFYLHQTFTDFVSKCTDFVSKCTDFVSKCTHFGMSICQVWLQVMEGSLI